MKQLFAHTIPLLLLTLWLGSCRTTTSRTESLPSLLPLELRESISSGDILFRRGRSFASLTVLSSDREGEYSHIGVAIEVDGRVMVTHAVPGQSQGEYLSIESVEEFFSHDNAKRGAVVRLTQLDSTGRRRIEHRARHLESQKIPFDHEYNATDSTKLYCTEYVWVLFNTVGVDLTRGQRAMVGLFNLSSPIIFPSHIFSHPDLELVGEF